MDTPTITLRNTPAFAGWIRTFADARERAILLRRLDRLRLGGRPDRRSVGLGVYEMRIAIGSGYRVYYAVHESNMFLLLGSGDPATQGKDIKRAQIWAAHIEDLGELHEDGTI